MRTLSIEDILYLGSRVRTRLFTRLIAKQFRQIGDGARVAPPFRFHGLNQIRLGEKVLIERDCWIHTVDTPDGESSVKLTIGSHTGIGMGATISAAQDVTIGAYVLLARNVYISDHSHAFEDITVPIMNQGIKNIRPVAIGRNTWLGQNVVILPGSQIGEHCVIGANSVVNSSIPSFSVAVGSPARVIKRYNQATGQWNRVESLA